jgi:hypothetical protein
LRTAKKKSDSHLRLSIKIGSHSELSLDFFLAIAEVVVGNDGDDNTAGISAGNLEEQ